MSESTEASPDGYAPLPRTSPVAAPWQPLYSKPVGSTLFVGLRVRKAHCHGRGYVHGEVISALADNAMGYSVQLTRGPDDCESTPRGGVTMHLSVDFLGRARPGEWLEFQPRVLRVGRTVAFTDCRVEADGKLVARADAVFRFEE